MVWMDVVSEIPHRMAEFLHIDFEQTDIGRNINEVSQCPKLKSSNFAFLVSWG